MPRGREIAARFIRLTGPQAESMRRSSIRCNGCRLAEVGDAPPKTEFFPGRSQHTRHAGLHALDSFVD